MSLFLEKGNEHEDEIEFVRFVGFYRIDTKVVVPRWEWELWGCPDRVEVSIRPA